MKLSDMTETQRRDLVCPNIENHTKSPLFYREWHEWAERMIISHFQIRCSECGLFSIWIPKEPIIIQDAEISQWQGVSDE